MLYLVDTDPWTEDDVAKQCTQYGLEFKPGFHFASTKTKLASAILKHAVAGEFGIPPEAIVVSDTGKPQVSEPQNVYFNITHHENIAIAVTSRTQEVGIDLTSVRTPFTPEQTASLFDPQPPEGLEGVYWAAREAYLKYTGVGIREERIKILKPAHSTIPSLESLTPLSVMPFIKVEETYARLFRAGKFVGAVIAPRGDISDVSVFSSEKE